MRIFSQKVLKIVRKISKGKALTYKQVARLAGRPHAYRAVGNILNKNYDHKIPCHRVIRSDGKLGGYNRGIKQKESLLRKEGFFKVRREQEREERLPFRREEVPE